MMESVVNNSIGGCLWSGCNNHHIAMLPRAVSMVNSEVVSELFLPPPPDMILAIPPPPLPGFMEGALGRIGSLLANGSCDLCDWAAGSGVGYVEMPRKGVAIDDTWFLVILASCLGATLLAILMALFILRYRQQRIKSSSEVSKTSKVEKSKSVGMIPPCVTSGIGSVGIDRCETVLYPIINPATENSMMQSRALWAGIRTSPPNHYTISHLQPVAQLTPNTPLGSDPSSEEALADYAYADYGSVGYTCLAAPPPLPVNPPPNGPPGMMVHAYYSADELGCSFENSGYVDSDDSCRGDGRLQLLGNVAASPLGEAFPMQTVGRQSWSRMSLDRGGSTRSSSSFRRPNIQSTIQTSSPLQVSSPTQIENPNLPPLNLQRRHYHSASLGKPKTRRHHNNNNSTKGRSVPTSVTLGKNSTAMTVVGRIRVPSPLPLGIERSSSFIAISSPLV